MSEPGFPEDVADAVVEAQDEAGADAGTDPGQPYGSWSTPITSELVVRAAAGLGGVALDGDDVWWSEARPEDGGRTQLVRWRAGTGPVDMLPSGANARTAAHEYGGGAWWVRGQTLWFTNWADQRLYRLVGRAMPVPVTPEPEVPRGE